MRLRNVWVSVLGLTFATSLVACGGGDSSSKPAAAPAGGPAGAPAAQKVDAATAGEVKGKIELDGAAPKNEPIKMAADPVCVKANPTPQFQETYVVGKDEGLGNVFVYVKDGLSGYTFDVPTTTANIDQKDCRYHPHVFGLRVGQPLEILNSDATLHNIHAQPKANQEFNNGQPVQGMKMTHTFTAKEVMVPFKCDVHGWMNAYVGVVDNPYFAVSDKDGNFSLPNLPPGTYTIEAWHEKLGTMVQTVTIGAKETKAIEIKFKPSGAAAS